MKCEKCKVNEACYHSTLIVNGHSQSTNLCFDCAKKEGAFDKSKYFDDIFNNFSNMLSFDFDDFFCPTCKKSFNQFKNDGYLGCEDCFDIFKDDFNRLIKKFEMENDFDNSNDEIEFRTPPKSEKQKEIDELQNKLQQAIKEERYEDAGEINKKIKELKNSNDKK